jgi:hypothetical protein
MFDYVKCEYPLPIPDELKNSKAFKTEKLEFQTHSMAPASMNEFEITDDGQIYLWDIKKEVISGKYGLEIKEASRELSKQDYSGEILISAMHMSKKYDYWIQYKILLWKGDVKEAHLEECIKEDNSGRLKIKNQFDEFVSKQTKRQNKWWYKVYMVYVRCIRGLMFFIRWVLGWQLKLTWKLERWLT